MKSYYINLTTIKIYINLKIISLIHFQKTCRTALLWLGLSPHSKKVLGLNPPASWGTTVSFWSPHAWGDHGSKSWPFVL